MPEAVPLPPPAHIKQLHLLTDIACIFSLSYLNCFIENVRSSFFKEPRPSLGGTEVLGLRAQLPWFSSCFLLLSWAPQLSGAAVLMNQETILFHLFRVMGEGSGNKPGGALSSWAGDLDQGSLRLLEKQGLSRWPVDPFPPACSHLHVPFNLSSSPLFPPHLTHQIKNKTQSFSSCLMQSTLSLIPSDSSFLSQ